MKIISVQFDWKGTNRYQILSQVFEHSVKKNCPDVELELIKVQAPDRTHKCRSKSFCANTLKLDLWLKALNETDQNVVFMDCDMIILKDISDAFNYDFDIGYTKRTRASMPYNGGVVFVKNTPEAKQFIQLWKNINDRMYKDNAFHNPYREKYAGMNQAAFGYILEKEKFKAKLKQFPCAVWNACDDDWRNMNKETRIVHVKSGLRRSVLLTRNMNTPYNRSIIVWNNLAIECGVVKDQVQQIDNITVMPVHPLINKVRGLRRRRKII